MSIYKKIGLMVSLSLYAGLLVVPVVAESPTWTPAQVVYATRDKPDKRMKLYRYDYYPQQQVYYLPERGSYFWLNGGVWRSGVSLPSAIQVYPRDRVSLDLDAERPYRSHPETMLRFPLD